MGLYFSINLDKKMLRLSQNSILFGLGGVKQNTILPQIIVTFVPVINAADLTVKAIRPGKFLNNTTGTKKKKIKYSPMKNILLTVKKLGPTYF